MQQERDRSRPKLRRTAVFLPFLFVLATLIAGQAQTAPQPAPEEWEGGGSHLIDREQWFYGQRAFPTGQIPAGARLNALHRRQQMQQEEQAARAQMMAAGITTAASTSSWTLVGPQPVSTPFIYGNVSGRVAALAVDPGNSSVVYLGAAQGGVWKSTNAGTSWTPLTDTQPSLAIGSL